MKTLSFRIVGVAPLLMHNGQLADRTNEYARQISEIASNRKKTDADYEQMAKLEWFGGLYLWNGEPCIPGIVFEATLIGKGGAARKERMGKEAAASVFVTKNFPLQYDGPRNPHELWKDKDFTDQSLVRIGQSKIMRTRPIFQQWSAEIEVQFNEALVNPNDLKRWIEVAGEQVGLMDWRPRYGRFSVEWKDG
jgi:hypothetical protein